MHPHLKQRALLHSRPTRDALCSPFFCPVYSLWCVHRFFRVTVTPDTRVQNAATMVIEREDHTLGNLLRMQLLADKEVLFAGYRVPHPLEPAIQVKVQTRTENPGPSQVTASALGNLINEVQTLTDRFQTALNKKEKNSAPKDDSATGMQLS